MAKSSINFAKASNGGLKHNDRTENNEPEYLLPVEYRLKNEVDVPAEKAEKRIKDLYATAKNNYFRRKRQRLQATSYLWEAVINLNEEHTLEDVQRLTNVIEKETGFTSIQIAIHRDEGRVEDNIPIYNLHAHITFFTLDKNGEQLYRRTIKASDRRRIEAALLVKNPELKKGEPKSNVRKHFNSLVAEEIKKNGYKVMDRERLSLLQDITAEIMKMERGKRGSEAVRMPHKQYKEAKRREAKAVNELREKAIAFIQEDRNKRDAKIMEIQAENSRLMEQLKELTRQKDLAIGRMEESIKKLKNNLSQSEEAKNGLKEQLDSAKVELGQNNIKISKIEAIKKHLSSRLSASERIIKNNDIRITTLKQKLKEANSLIQKMRMYFKKIGFWRNFKSHTGFEENGREGALSQIKDEINGNGIDSLPDYELIANLMDEYTVNLDDLANVGVIRYYLWNIKKAQDKKKMQEIQQKAQKKQPVIRRKP